MKHTGRCDNDFNVYTYCWGPGSRAQVKLESATVAALEDLVAAREAGAPLAAGGEVNRAPPCVWP
jgi:hypothetical protein